MTSMDIRSSAEAKAKKAGADRDKLMQDAKDKALRTDKTRGPQRSKRGHPPPRPTATTPGTAPTKPTAPTPRTAPTSPREALEKLTGGRPMTPRSPKPPPVAFDPVTGIPPKGKQPPTKPMTTTPGDRPISTAPSTPADRAPAVPIRKGYTPNPTKPTGPMTPMPNEGSGPMGPRLDPRGPVKSAMAKGGRVSLSSKAKKSSSVGNVRKFSHGGKIDGCAVRGKTNTKKF